MVCCHVCVGLGQHTDMRYRTFDFVSMTHTIQSSQTVHKIQRSVSGRLATTRNFDSCREVRLSPKSSVKNDPVSENVKGF